MKKYYWFLLVSILSSLSCHNSNPVDGDGTDQGGEVVYGGKTYHAVKIGNQTWLKENLDIGTMIDSLQNAADNDTIEKYCYGNDPANCVMYGGLYQWNEAMQYVTTPGAQGICPPGWHMPTKAEYDILKSAVGGDGNALKEVGQGTGAGAGTNTSGFSALLAGGRGSTGSFGYLGQGVLFWSSYENDPRIAGYLGLVSNNHSVGFYDDPKDNGFSVRCVQD